MVASSPIQVPQVGEVFRHILSGSTFLAEVLGVDKNGIHLATENGQWVVFKKKVWVANGHAWVKYHGDREMIVPQWMRDQIAGTFIDAWA